MDPGSFGRSAVLFMGCMLLGLGIGMLFDEAGAGILIGLGLGFLMSGLRLEKRLKTWARAGSRSPFDPFD